MFFPKRYSFRQGVHYWCIKSNHLAWIGTTKSGPLPALKRINFYRCLARFICFEFNYFDWSKNVKYKYCHLIVEIVTTEIGSTSYFNQYELLSRVGEFQLPVINIKVVDISGFANWIELNFCLIFSLFIIFYLPYRISYWYNFSELRINFSELKNTNFRVRLYVVSFD